MAMTPADPLFVDINVLVYANVLEAPFHERALRTIHAAQQAGQPLWLVRRLPSKKPLKAAFHFDGIAAADVPPLIDFT